MYHRHVPHVDMWTVWTVWRGGLSKYGTSSRVQYCSVRRKPVQPQCFGKSSPAQLSQFASTPVKIDPVQIGFLRIKSIYLPISGHFPVRGHSYIGNSGAVLRRSFTAAVSAVITCTYSSRLFHIPYVLYTMLRYLDVNGKNK